MSGVEDLVLRQCVWYRSGSITYNNEYFVKCHYICKEGFDKSCPMYMGKQTYLKAKLETCKRINAKNNNVDKGND